LFVKKDKGKGQEFGFTEYEIAFLTAAVHGERFSTRLIERHFLTPSARVQAFFSGFFRGA